MTKALLQTIKAEYEFTDITLTQICAKYSCTTKDLKGYSSWIKHPEKSVSSAIKLVYETVYSPTMEVEEIDTKQDDTQILTVEEVEAEIVHTAELIKESKPIDIGSLPKQARDGFEGLRMLDTKLQAQALTLLQKLDEMTHYIETAKDLKDLVTSHTAIRDSYFNTKAPMINILNGDVVQGDKNELATLLNGVGDDC
jgi:hypothetical protein